MNLKNALIVFTKLPVAGKVKTRLAKKLGSDVAASFYKACTENLFSSLSEIQQNKADIYIFYHEENDLSEIKNWIGNGYSYYQQKGKNLGDKMYNAFNLIFSLGYEKVIIIGADIPDIDNTLLSKAFRELDGNQCVIGPTNDGGYYLLGFRSKLIDVFSGVEWSSGLVLNTTIKKLEQHSVTFHLLDALIDIDTLEDLKKWVTQFKGDENHFIKSFLKLVKI